MKTTLENIPVISKSNVTPPATEALPPRCCTPKADATACCESSKSSDENNGACCAQPADGSACCSK